MAKLLLHRGRTTGFMSTICPDDCGWSITSGVIGWLTGVLAQQFVMTLPLVFCSVESNAIPG
jgi:hypothetical protein